MIWQKEVLTKFGMLNLEIQNSLEHNNINIVVARLPNKDTITEIKKLIPYEVQFIERVKIKTENTIEHLFANARCTMSKSNKGRKITYHVRGVVEDQELWNAVSDVLIKDGFYDLWSFNYEGKTITFSRDVFLAIETRKVTGTSLDEQDLKIALETSQDVNDFLLILEGGTFNRR